MNLPIFENRDVEEVQAVFVGDVVPFRGVEELSDGGDVISHDRC